MEWRSKEAPRSLSEKSGGSRNGKNRSNLKILCQLETARTLLWNCTDVTVVDAMPGRETITPDA